MAKPKKQGFSIQGFDAEHIRQSEQYTQMIDALYNQAVSDYAQMAGKLNVDPSKPFSFKDYPGAKAKAEAYSSQLASKMEAVISKGSAEQWLFACKKNDAFIASIIDTSKIKKSTLNKFQDRNLDALKTFQTRKVNGLGLSDRIWNYAGQMKTQMEMGIDLALGDGKSAQALSRELKQYLVDPDKLFKRVRDKHGVLQLSKNAKAYHPGQGKYRSSHKNALRLTRSEINMAYRESDHLRWNQLDFVVGFEVKLSNNHPVYDICDIVQGKYPKDFKFIGWHPQCRCKAIPILQDPKEFDTDELNELKAAINGTEYKPFQSANTVTDVPNGFKDWIAENAERSKGWKSQPYFIKDNFVGGSISGGLKVATKSAELIAADKLAAQVAKAAAAEAAKVAAEALAAEQAAALAKAEALAAEEAIAAAKAKVLADKIASELTYANKKIAEAEALGVTGKNLEKLKLAIQDNTQTYSQLSGKSSKLVQDIKAQKLINKDPFGKPALLLKYSESEVDSLFKAYDNFYQVKINNLDIAGKIKKLEYEVNWLADNGKYSTSGVLREILQRDLLLLKKELQLQLDNAELFEALNLAKYKLSNAAIENKAIQKATKELEAEIAKKGATVDSIKLKLEKYDSAINDYYSKGAGKSKEVFKGLGDTEIQRLLADYEINSKESMDKLLRKQTEQFWNSLSFEERNVITKYTQTYSYLNEPLRGLPFYGQIAPNADHLKDMPILTAVLNKCKTPQNMVVRRGTNSWEIKELGYGLDKLKSGDVFVDKGFSSTAIHRSGGFDSSYDFVIVVPKGSSGVYAEPFSHFTDSGKFSYGSSLNSANLWNGISKETLKSEIEWIGQRGAKYRVIKKTSKSIYLELIGQMH